MKRYIYSAAALSWIDPKAGLPEWDGDQGPDEQLTMTRATRTKNCRFSHILVCQITVDDAGKIVEHSILPMSGLYMHPSALWTAPQAYKVKRDPGNIIDGVATFVQTVGCRTQAPELIGGRAGEEIGGALGPIVGGPVGAILGRPVGRILGKATAERTLVFPPIWSRLSVQITADGRCYPDMPAHSLFPSVSYYATQRETLWQPAEQPTPLWYRLSVYDGVPHLDEWQAQGWGKGNPWLVNHP
jgi:hypothetical protein